MTTIAVTKEGAGEPRVAVSPETAKKFVGLGCVVKIESGAGLRSRFADSLYTAQGGSIAGSAAEALAGADLLLKVRRPTVEEVKALNSGALVVTMLDPFSDRAGRTSAAFAENRSK